MFPAPTGETKPISHTKLAAARWVTRLRARVKTIATTVGSTRQVHRAHPAPARPRAPARARARRNDRRRARRFVLSTHTGRENGWDAIREYTAPKTLVVRITDEPEDWFAGGKRYG